MVVHAYNPDSGQAYAERSLELTGQSQIFELQVQWENLVPLFPEYLPPTKESHRETYDFL